MPETCICSALHAQVRADATTFSLQVWQCQLDCLGCARRDVVHRDLKPENILLADKSDDADVKVCMELCSWSEPHTPHGATLQLADFGLSRFRGEDDELMTTGMCMVQSNPGVVSPFSCMMVCIGLPSVCGTWAYSGACRVVVRVCVRLQRVLRCASRVASP